MAELGRRVRVARGHRGMTQKEVAQAAGIATGMISRLESGRYQNPGLRTIMRIADGLGASVSELLPDASLEPQVNSAELSQRARLIALAGRAEAKARELTVEIARLIVNR